MASEPFVFYPGDYAYRLQHLAESIQRADRDNTALLAGEDHPGDVLRDEYSALKAEADRAAQEKRHMGMISGLGRTEWRGLKARHPARTEGDPQAIEGDRTAGCNADAIEDDLVFAAVTDPEFSSRGDFDEWADTLSEGEWETLVITAWRLTNGATNAANFPDALPTRNTETS